MFKKRSTKELLGNIEPATPNDEVQIKSKNKKPKKEKQPFSFKRLFKNRALLAGICITVAFVFSFVVIPIVQSLASRSVEVVTVTKDLKPGDILTDADLSITSVGGFNIAPDAIENASDAIGKYVKVEMLEGDILQEKKIATDMVTDDTYLLDLPDGKLAMSIGIPNLAEGLSAKLRRGDIIRVFSLIDNAAGVTEPISPSELQYVEVLAVTNDDTHDIENGAKIVPGVNSDASDSDSEERKISTVTLAVDTTQALALTALGDKTHIALVYRGDNETKNKMLQIQNDYTDKTLTEVTQ